ncbi:MAG: hypothetical protein KAR42_18025 [candidate division Zixibacteria bacterium]|nr:hypothetical protein [candidate division Zixibacteria bacterium]
MATYKELEIVEIRKIAEGFKGLILQRQAEYDNNGIDYAAEDLLKGTPYEAEVKINNYTILWETELEKYNWKYTRRVGNAPAFLTEINGFN